MELIPFACLVLPLRKNSVQSQSGDFILGVSITVLSEIKNRNSNSHSVFHYRIKISKLNEIYELVSNFVAEKNISKIDVKCIKWRSWCAVVWWVIQIPIASEQPSTTITLDQCTTACRVDHTLFDFFKRRLQNFAESVNLYGWNREMLWVFGKPHIIFHEHRHLAVYAIWLVYTLLPNWRWGPHLPANYFVYIGNDMEEIRFQAFTIFKKLL